MPNKVCFVYPWATLGGVERVLLNRALAFKRLLPDVEPRFWFLHDAGGLPAFRRELRRSGLDDEAAIVTSADDDYAFVSLIDCPQVAQPCLDQGHRLLMECHTTYPEHQRYLRNLPERCERLIVPSPTFGDAIGAAYPGIASRVHVLRNFVPWDTAEPGDRSEGGCLPQWTRTPLLFLGRMDSHKDPVALVEAFRLLEQRRPGRYMLLLCGPRSPELDLDAAIRDANVTSATVCLPPVAFHATSRLLDSVAHAGGIFVSPSHGESFGLSAAEAIASLVPVVLSDVPAHLALVSGSAEFSYPLGDVSALADRIDTLHVRGNASIVALRRFRQELSAQSFVRDWTSLCESLGGRG